jgi:hypothetical protein
MKIMSVFHGKSGAMRAQNTSIEFFLHYANNVSTDLINIFKPLLSGITGLMKQQIRLALDAGLQIQV